jgi:ribosomal protein L22
MKMKIKFTLVVLLLPVVPNLLVSASCSRVLKKKRFRLASALEAALEALAATQRRIDEEIGDARAPTRTSGAAENATREAFASLLASAVNNAEAHRVAADKVLERVQSARTDVLDAATAARAAERARGDLDALYDARVVNALRDAACPARQARARMLAERLADRVWTRHENSFEAALITMRDILRAASADPHFTHRQRESIGAASTQHIEMLMWGVHVPPEIVAAANKMYNGSFATPLGALVSRIRNVQDKERLIVTVADSVVQDSIADLTLEMARPAASPDAFIVVETHRPGTALGMVGTLSLWLSVFQTVQHRHDGVTRDSILAQILSAEALLSQFGGSVASGSVGLAAQLRSETLIDLERQGDCIATAFREELARAKRTDDVEIARALKGGRRDGSARGSI